MTMVIMMMIMMIMMRMVMTMMIIMIMTLIDMDDRGPGSVALADLEFESWATQAEHFNWSSGMASVMMVTMMTMMTMWRIYLAPRVPENLWHEVRGVCPGTLVNNVP